MLPIVGVGASGDIHDDLSPLDRTAENDPRAGSSALLARAVLTRLNLLEEAMKARSAGNLQVLFFGERERVTASGKTWHSGRQPRSTLHQGGRDLP